ncbi:hypothetical protein CTI14_71215, partial [Methylobacterium radiotolerans]
EGAASMSAARSVRLDKLLANLGYGSRREIQALARAARSGEGAASMSAARSVRLDKLLANLGYGSRREIQALA